MLPVEAVVADAMASPVIAGILDVVRAAIESATGPGGLLIIAVYSFLIAFILPLPSEVVLAAPLDLGLGYFTTLGVIVIVSGLGKAAGSLVAFHIGQEVKHSGAVLEWLARHGIDAREWSRRQTVRLAQRWGYAGLALALSVPFFPDTLSIYAFAILERDYLKFALATFVGSVGRLLITVFVVGGTLRLTV